MVQLKLFIASVLLRVASGFRVDFWGGAQCTDSALGTWIGGPDQGCQRLFVGEAEGVTVESTGPVDDNTVLILHPIAESEGMNLPAEVLSTRHYASPC
jgi:hypothetical protein